jgi:hypothetical protein
VPVGIADIRRDKRVRRVAAKLTDALLQCRARGVDPEPEASRIEAAIADLAARARTNGHARIGEGKDTRASENGG